MKKILKLLLCVGIAFHFPLTAFHPLQAQSGSNAPFSQYGLGLGSQPCNMPMTARLGGVAYTRSGNNFVNPFNPASYATVEMQSFVFDMAFGVYTAAISDASNRVGDAGGELAYITFAMPITKWWKIGGGIMPFSSTDYESVGTFSDPTSGNVLTRYDGYGGVSEAFIGSAFNIVKPAGRGFSLQAGFNVELLTGAIQRTISYEPLGSDTSYFLSSRKLKNTRVRNVVFDAGVQARMPLGEKYTLAAGVVFKPGMKLAVDEDAIIYTFFRSAGGLSDTVFPQRGESNRFTSQVETPSTLGVGLSLERDNKWMLAADVTLAPWSGVKYTEGSPIDIFGQSAIRYGSYGRYAMAFELTGDRDATSYARRISWSAGVHYETAKMRLAVGGAEAVLDEWGCGIGATLPMRKGRSLLTLSAAYSHFGAANPLLQETLTFGIAVSSCESWFVKRKYN